MLAFVISNSNGGKNENLSEKGSEKFLKSDVSNLEHYEWWKVSW